MGLGIPFHINVESEYFLFYKCVRRLSKPKFASYLGAVMGKLKNIKYLQVLSRFLLCSRYLLVKQDFIHRPSL